MRLMITACFALILTACSGNYRQVQNDESGYLPTGDDADIRITINHGVDTSQFKKTLYVSMDMHGITDWYGYQDYVMESFRQLDFFGEVVTREPTIYVNTTPPVPTKRYDDKKAWFDVVDPVSYSQIVKQYGPNVLIAKTILRNKTDDYGDTNGFFFQLQLIDPQTSRVLFQGSKAGVNVLGLDLNLINPVLNYAKGYLLNHDPYYVPEHPPKVLDTNPGATTPFTYEQGWDR